MDKKEFWAEWERFDGIFGTRVTKLCKRHGFVTRLKGWNYCPYCGGELCE